MASTQDRPYWPGYTEAFDHIVKCINEKNFKLEAAAQDGAFVLQLSVPGLFSQRRIRVRIVVDDRREGRVFFDAPGPRRTAIYSSGGFQLW